jgi:hypothetical protein
MGWLCDCNQSLKNCNNDCGFQRHLNGFSIIYISILKQKYSIYIFFILVQKLRGPYQPIYYIIIIVRFASHAKINTFSVFILKNETGDPSVSQVLKLLESGFDSPEGSL